MGTAQNSVGSGRKPPKGRPFPKGVSGNPGGRPKSIKALIIETAKNGDPREIVRFQFELMRGKASGVRAGKVPVKERRAAAEWLGNQLFGKAAQAIELSGAGGGPVQTFDVEKLSDEQLEQLVALAAVASDAESAAGAGEGGEGGEGAPTDG